MSTYNSSGFSSSGPTAGWILGGSVLHAVKWIVCHEPKSTDSDTRFFLLCNPGKDYGDRGRTTGSPFSGNNIKGVADSPSRLCIKCRGILEVSK